VKGKEKTSPKQNKKNKLARKSLGFKNYFLMKDFTTYLSTAPIVSLVWLAFTAGLIIMFNKFYPDPLIFTF